MLLILINGKEKELPDKFHRKVKSIIIDTESQTEELQQYFVTFKQIHLTFSIEVVNEELCNKSMN